MIMDDFLVVNTLLVYNVILRWLALSCLWAATSTNNLIMKSEVRDNKHGAKMCYALTIKRNESVEIVHMVEIIQKALKLVESMLALEKTINSKSLSS